MLGEGERQMTPAPPHPGTILRELHIDPLGVTVTDAARALGISRKSLSALLNGRQGVSPEMAIRLELALEVEAAHWLELQLKYDLWQAEQKRDSLKVSRISRVAEKEGR
jgi:addiction module HigA family antidote